MKMKSVLVIFFTLFVFFVVQAQELNNPWEVPDEYKEMVNPVDADKNSISDGKVLYKQHCKICHGKVGMGDGSSAEALNENPSNLSLDDVDVMKDGEVYYKILTGREEMHAFKVVLEENDIWNLVNYIRTLHPDLK